MIKRIARGAKIINIGSTAEVEKAVTLVREAELL
jgi:hypothetical protein